MGVLVGLRMRQMFCDSVEVWKSPCHDPGAKGAKETVVSCDIGL